MNRAEFYRLRDLRTRDYGIAADPLERPVGIAISGEAAESPAGQVAALALINMAARVHRRLRILVPEQQLLVSSLIPASSFGDAVVALVTAIDPFNEIAIVQSGDRLALPDATIGVGAVPHVPLAISARRYTATLSNEALAFGNDPSTTVGACLGACFGAAGLLHLALGREPRERRTSLWTLADETGEGSGPGDAPSRIDVGNVAVIGAGAVGSALAYWLRLLGVEGEAWAFVDGDVVELHNTSRGVGLLAAHAGWSASGLTGDPAKKAEVTAALVGGKGFPVWYEEWVQTGDEAPDLIIPVANGPGVRSAVAERGEAVLVHGTTSRRWSADLHRHLAESDGCIRCRLPESPSSPPPCSTAQVRIGEETVDAALPFLSAGAGLLIVRALERLATGSLAAGVSNHWELHLDEATQPTLRARRWSCDSQCATRRHLPQSLRRTLPRGRLWAHLD